MTDKREVMLDIKYSAPTNRNYFDESTSTVAAPTVFDPTKRGADYGIKDPEVTVDVPTPTV